MATLTPITRPDPPSTSPMSGRRERLEKRFASAKAVRDPYDNDFAEIERLCLPARSRYSSGSNKIKRMANTSKQDSAGIIAGRTLVHGMSTGLSSPSRPWFKLSTGDNELDNYEPVKLWLFDTERRIYEHFAKTNYYDATKIAYSELAHMGFAVTLGIEHSQYDAVYHAFDHNEVWIAEDDGLRVSTLFYKPSYTVDQMVRKFPWNKLSRQVRDAYDKSNTQQLVPVTCVIEKNDDRDHTKLDSANKPWRSTWWETNNPDKSVILKEGGFDSKPFSAARWETNGGEVYSTSSPGWNSLADLRELEFTARRKGRAMDMMVRPPVFLPASLQQTAMSLDPGSMNFINDMQGKVDTLRIDPNVGSWITSEVERLTKRVNQLFYADLWMAVTDMDGIQPRNEQELQYRNEEKLTQLATANSAIERAAQFVGYLAGQFPEAALKFDAEQAIDEFARNSHTSPKIIRSDEIVAQMKEQQAQQQQAQQMAAMAQPAQQGAQAAQLLSQTHVSSPSGGGSMLDQMMNPT